MQKGEIEYKKWNWVQNGEIKMFDSSYFELGQTKLSLSELKYTGADRDGITRFQLKK